MTQEMCWFLCLQSIFCSFIICLLKLRTVATYPSFIFLEILEIQRKGARFRPKSHMYFIILNFRGFFLWSLAVLFLIARYFLDIYVNYMAFWPLILSFSFTQNFRMVLILLELIALDQCSQSNEQQNQWSVVLQSRESREQETRIFPESILCCLNFSTFVKMFHKIY